MAAELQSRIAEMEETLRLGALDIENLEVELERFAAGIEEKKKVAEAQRSTLEALESRKRALLEEERRASAAEKARREAKRRLHYEAPRPHKRCKVAAASPSTQPHVRGLSVHCVGVREVTAAQAAKAIQGGRLEVRADRLPVYTRAMPEDSEILGRELVVSRGVRRGEIICPALTLREAKHYKSTKFILPKARVYHAGIYLQATRKVKAGEPLTIDYGYSDFSEEYVRGPGGRLHRLAGTKLQINGRTYGLGATLLAGFHSEDAQGLSLYPEGGDAHSELFLPLGEKKSSAMDEKKPSAIFKVWSAYVVAYGAVVPKPRGDFEAIKLYDNRGGLIITFCGERGPALVDLSTTEGDPMPEVTPRDYSRVQDLYAHADDKYTPMRKAGDAVVPLWGVTANHSEKPNSQLVEFLYTHPSLAFAKGAPVMVRNEKTGDYLPARVVRDKGGSVVVQLAKAEEPAPMEAPFTTPIKMWVKWYLDKRPEWMRAKVEQQEGDMYRVLYPDYDDGLDEFRPFVQLLDPRVEDRVLFRVVANDRDIPAGKTVALLQE